MITIVLFKAAFPTVILSNWTFCHQVSLKNFSYTGKLKIFSKLPDPCYHVIPHIFIMASKVSPHDNHILLYVTTKAI